MVSALPRIVFGLLLVPFAVQVCVANDSPLSQAQRLELTGEFRKAEQILDAALAQPDLAPETRYTLVYERDRLDRIRRDYTLTRDQLEAKVLEGVKEATPEEFAQWLDQGRFDSRKIDGTRYFMARSVRNLFYRHPELNDRRTRPADEAEVQRFQLELCRQICAAAKAEQRPYVLTKKFDVRFTGTVHADAVADGDLIKAWLPIPREFPFQRDFRLIGSSPTPLEIAPGDSPMRSAYFEQTAQAGEPTKFDLHFTFEHDAIRFEIDPALVTPLNRTNKEIARFAQEGPHTDFTPELLALSQQIVGDEKNPAIAARKIYDWIGHNIQYSLAIEYSTIRNLSDYCREHKYGDCGQEGMLFIALCRANGIPARWQSGWNLFPNRLNIHDWSEIYLAPYGWVPVDVCRAVSAYQEMTHLTDSERQEVADFYFGGLEPYRMAANCDHSQALTPAKLAPPSDTIDFQRGEYEVGDVNLYYDKFTYDFTIQEIEPTTPTKTAAAD
ncbi:transglutaminase-like domain-containing protein [Blastopirellula sp. JC732]|uniref:Transglutaminase-like domain-containing protein n=1 Tax=Blastopirellula sediminis TaxID=2894196 RepID=A0A9X1MPA2_9BACT|nr:transglutaminase-like domain-containing protein [Blastopirellula sediminis]MCC9606291.1 transglutaminase-like domain-containing protein [Blastopirellula sediminis]MCC9630411.1 transglutaminase-like domain-containing protein [Blastopirellula sediminis]